MPDPEAQKTVDQAIKRDTNLTPTGVRTALTTTAVDFARRTDAAAKTSVEASVPKQPTTPTVTTQELSGQPVTLPSTQPPTSFPSDSSVAPNKQVIIVDNGTAYYYSIPTVFNGPV